MNHKLRLEVEPLPNIKIKNDLDVAGTYEVSLIDETGEDLGSKCMSAFMNEIPISLPENFTFSIKDIHDNDQHDHGNSYSDIYAKITKVQKEKHMMCFSN